MRADPLVGPGGRVPGRCGRQRRQGPFGSVGFWLAGSHRGPFAIGNISCRIYRMKLHADRRREQERNRAGAHGEKARKRIHP